MEEKIGKLLQADELNDGNLSETLENYLNCSCNAKKTAEEMFLHRNTLNYRLKKIREILGCDLENLDTCLELKMAFLISDIGIADNRNCALCTKKHTTPAY